MTPPMTATSIWSCRGVWLSILVLPFFISTIGCGMSGNEKYEPAKAAMAASGHVAIATPRVTRVLGESIYEVPIGYLESFADQGAAPLKVDYFGFIAFYPDFSGRDDGSNSDRDECCKINAIIQAGNSTSRADAVQMLNNMVETKSVSPEISSSDYDLVGRKKTALEPWGGWVRMGKNSRGSVIFMDCTESAPKNICSIKYFESDGQYWINYYYDSRYVADWKAIDDGLHNLILSWRVN